MFSLMVLCPLMDVCMFCVGVLNVFATILKMTLNMSCYIDIRTLMCYDIMGNTSL